MSIPAPPPAAAAAAPEPATAPDALLAALLWLTRHHGREHSAASLLAGQAVDAGLLTPAQALRVLQAASFKAGVVERPLAQLSELLMPAVLLLHERQACVVLRRLEGARYEVADPLSGAVSVQAEAELAPRHTGFVLVATPQATPTSEADRVDAPHWLWSTLRRFAPHYRTAMLAALLSNVLTLVIGTVTSVTYDKVIPHQAFATLWALAAVALAALLFDTAARQLRAYLIDVAGKKADLLMGMALYRQTLEVRMEHRPASAGACAHQMAQVELVRDFTTSATLSVLTDLPFVLLFVAAIFVVAGPLGWVMVAAIPLVLGATLLMQNSLRRAMRANMQFMADQQALLVESLEGLEDVKATGAEGRFVGRFEVATAAAAEASLRSRRMASWSNNLASSSQQLVTLVMLVWGVYLIADNQLSSGGLIGAVMFASRAIAPLASVVGLATRYQGARAALRALDNLMGLPTERVAGAPALPPTRLSGRIALRDVQFAYPPTSAAPPPVVLKGVNLRFEPGERVAILGRIGSGKSTVLRILAGLYEPTQGRVEVDGIDLRQLDRADFRTQVGFVSQEPRLFKGTLRDNVTMGRPGIDAAALTEVAQLTGLDRVVAAHPQGWELEVGELGVLLSGGQRQLVALARCLVTRPRILLMDEPTSSMDAQSEQVFVRQLAAAAGDRTLVMVTHRPAVLELAQRVVVVDAGQVLLDGPKPLVLAALAGQKSAPAHPGAAAATPAPAAAAAVPPSALPAAALAARA
ncbi:type I secretion system permease/ATPase [Azohydromonas caseinilytica]|uniref:Cyclolysin secretion/processing ATP-binding protein CyaB n=1 Tax=Azohydromonas caseinilytica TaxID=2728836 RepID=A0A848F8N8_9BURK|nr:type I secretion system permease/ATPase [Azohydromonas caseinilytica]NML14879.1 type I secretion system permease/ATPase [Azohydromonas caseinilytica]